MSETPFSIYFLFPSSVFILIIGTYLFVQKKKIATIIFFITALLQFFWMLSTLILWQSINFGILSLKYPLVVKLLSLSVFLIPAFLYHFSLEFCHIHKQKPFLFFVYVASIGLVIANNAESVIKEIFSRWIPGAPINFIYISFAVLALILLFTTLFNFMSAWLNREEKRERRQEMLLFILLCFGIYGLTFVYFLPYAFINILPIFFLMIPIYVLILGFIVIEKDPFISILTVDITVAVILVLLASFIVFPGMELGVISKSIIFVLIAVICFLLLRYMNKINNQKMAFELLIEERTKELQEKTWRLNELNDQLEESNAVLEVTVKARTRELKELNDNLELQIQSRTKELKKKTNELEEKIKELEEFSDIFINRENKMVELKEKIKDLQNEKKKGRS
jgi:large-conductance mechanosensitive channel